MFDFLSKGSTHQARINGKPITVEPDETLLQAALRQDITIPNICRVGGCGSCKCKLQKGQVQELTETAYLLSEDEIEDGYILACQSRLKSDADFELNAEGAISTEPVQGTIVSRELLTHDIVRINIQLESPLEYKAGQYAVLTLSSIPDAPRSYSFANAPSSNGLISFTIKRVSGGRFSNYVFEEEIIGDQLTVMGPGGDFWLREGTEKIVFVAGGSGLAPILGILEEMERQGDRRPVTLLFGARKEQDLYETETLSRYEKNWPDFRFIPILSEDDDNEKWKGCRGLVTDHILKESAGATQAYLCGPPQMIDAAINSLETCGIKKERIYADRFVVQEVKNTGFYGAVGLPTVNRTSATIGDYLKFMAFHFIGLSAVFAFLAGGHWISLGLAGLIAYYVIGDLIGGEDTVTPEYKTPGIMTVQLWLALPILSMIAISYIWSLSSGDPLGIGTFVTELTGYNVIAAREATASIHHYLSGTIYFGLLIGFIGTVTAHELTHRTWDPISLWIGRWLLAFSFDVGFAIEHVYGHHRYVSTEHDPATAPRGRNVYHHIIASTISGNISAAKIESERLRRKNLPILSLQNSYLRGLLMSLVLVVIAFMMAGWTGALYFTLCGFIGKALLEIVNYMEHYGMVRLPDQPVQPRHSWNTNSRMSSWGMFNLSRHSHHHAQGEVPYHDLMPLPDAPIMINGYMGTIILTLYPPLWHKLMTPKLLEWDKNYASAEERILALRANQRSGIKELLEYDPREWTLTTTE